MSSRRIPGGAPAADFNSNAFLVVTYHILLRTSVVATMASGIQYLNDLPIVTLTNANGMLVNISLVGAIIQALVVPDRCNIKENVVLGFNMDELYLNGSSPSFGCEALSTPDNHHHHATQRCGWPLCKPHCQSHIFAQRPAVHPE